MKLNIISNEILKKIIWGTLISGIVFTPAITFSNEVKKNSNSLYMMPPKEISTLVDAPLTSGISISPDKKWMLLMERSGLPSLLEISQPELKPAGLRINPVTNGPSHEPYYNGLILKSINENTEFKIKGLPVNPKINYVTWAPDGKNLAFVITAKNGVELWTLNIKTKKARKLSAVNINFTLGRPFYWLSDNKTLIYTAIDKNRGKAPDSPEVPSGPVLQESFGKVAASRTFPDLLSNSYDESLFEYYFSSQIYKVTLDGVSNKMGSKAIILNFEPSPDGKYILVEKIHKPFSYLVPYYRFPQKVEIWDRNGNTTKEIVDLPLAEEVPISFDAVTQGPRNFGWRTDSPSTLYWVEAQDKGDPKIDSKIRDILFTLKSPFTSKSIQFLSLEYRFDKVLWGNDKFAIVEESWWKNRKKRTWIFSPDSPKTKPEILFDRSSEDKYGDPGTPVLKENSNGVSVLLLTNGSLFFTGQGASPEGNRPFLDKLDLKTKIKERLWRSNAPYYELPINLIDENSKRLLTRIESTNKQPNYYLRDFNKNKIRQLTFFPNPTPQLSKVKKEIIKYEREDGVKLNATLYLPENYKKGNGSLPMLMWAYPREFKNADSAGQISGLPYEFVRIGWGSPLFFLTQGYAILEGPSMPIIGEGDKEPNDTYIKQLVSSAEAAVNEVVKLGIADRNRIAIGGHSYGAFMTANLLAHSDLFRTGIARSGAYNRTLTPFGFQSEERTLWQAPQIYSNMSPFNNADKINEPILLIHGMNDNNPGTFPMQTERLFNALKGLGGNVRMVMLPFESHHYQARESVMHMLWEMNTWLDKYVKNAKPEKNKTPKGA